jgi:hypothetical protein
MHTQQGSQHRPPSGRPTPRFVGVPRPGDGRGAVATVRIFPADAAVSLLSRNGSTLRGTLGGGGGGAALRALASDAAVGANRPDVGRDGRGVGVDNAPAAVAAAAEFFAGGVFGREAGVFGREVAVACIVGDLAAVVVRGSVDGALRMPVALRWRARHGRLGICSAGCRCRWPRADGQRRF